MKKTHLAAASLAVAFCFFSQPVLAALPQIQYSGNETVDFQWENMSKTGTIEPGIISFTVNFNSKSNGLTKYKIICMLDGRNVINEATEIPAATTTEKTFSFSADAGIHNVSVSISKNGTIMYDKTEDIYVVKSYTKQPMDELSGRGINVHYERTPYKEDVEFTNDLMFYSGLKTVRLGLSWEYIEKQKGVYDFTQLNAYYDYLREHGMTAYWCSGYGNGWLYLPERGMDPSVGWNVHTRHQAPQTQESIRAYAKTAVEVVKENETRDVNFFWEGWNELNSGPDPVFVAQQYNDITMPVKIELIREGLDKGVDICGYTPHSNNIDTFLNSSMYMGFYPYFDRYAAHTYQFKNGFEASNLYDTRMKGHDDFITEWGGWKIVDMTETGFTTPKGSNATSTLESAANEVAKLYTICEYNNIEQIMLYDLMNDGTDETYTEHNFGAVTYEGKPKPHYLALTNYNNQTSGGILVGEFDTGLGDGARAFLYYKNEKPVVIAWANLIDGSEPEWDLTGESVDITDNYGNIVARNADRAKLGRETVYLHGLSNKWIKEAVLFDTKKLNALWLEDYPDGLSVETMSKIRETFKDVENKLSKAVSAEESEKLIASYADLGRLIIEEGNNQKISEIEVSKRLYKLFRIIEKLSKLYLTLYDSDNVPLLSDRYDESYKKARELYLNDVQMKQYSNAILVFAGDYNKKARLVSQGAPCDTTAGYIATSNKIVDILCDWFDGFSAYESLTNIGLQIQTPYYDRKSYINTNVETEVNLNNYTKEDFSGTICVLDEDGNKVYETPKLKVKANGGYLQTNVVISTARPKDAGGITYYDFAYVNESGEILKMQKMGYEVQDRFEVSMLPCTEKPNELKKVQLKIKNLTQTRQSAHIKMETDGSFKFKSSSIDVSIDKGETKIVDLPVVSIENNKYHFHSLNYTVTDEAGNIVAQKDAALSFTNVVKAKNPISVADFNGDISDWQDAYPIYINTPQDITNSESWQNAECSARAFFKWDEEHLYCLLDIYDDAFLQPFTGVNMWQGDSIQISIDSNHDKATSYQPDDYELGFAHTPLGHEFYYWYAPKELSVGVVDWFKMIRNDDLHFSRYLIAMDKSVLPTVRFEDGAKYGLNIALNDNDYLAREGIYQFTLGTADSKNPSLYADFNFITADDEQLLDGIANTIFPISVENKVTQKKSDFSDIAGHWAENTINNMSALGHVSGMGDGKFYPDTDMTRAEFFSVLTRGAKMSGDGNGFSDVDENNWYYQAVCNIREFIPDAMINDNKIEADKKITRQEAIYLISRCYSKNKEIGNIQADYKSYLDGADVSEWAAEGVNIALDNGLIKGSTDGKLYPKSSLTRAEATMMIYNLLSVL